mmetsp:Transcript_23454/g.51493  ORF Transcript_23454/g.51493 Transcript_23454/m.51493 type:complete len:201 (-) Transcript_23454:240-842(-)
MYSGIACRPTSQILRAVPRRSIAACKQGKSIAYRGNCRPSSRGRTVAVHAEANPVRATLDTVVNGIFKLQGALSASEPGASPLWTAIKRIDLTAVNAAITANTYLNERDSRGDTPLIYVAREGHYKYIPSEIPAALIRGGADLEARDSKGLSALQVSLLSGWYHTAELLISSRASTAGVAAIKSRVTCPDCKRLIARYNL